QFSGYYFVDIIALVVNKVNTLINIVSVKTP
ncbi:unnamed protein product, partial [marine sediment metagenome]